MKAYKSYLRKAPANAPNRESVRRLVAQLEEAISAEAAAKPVTPAPEPVHPTPEGGAAVPAAALPTNAQPATTVSTTAATPADKPLVKKAWFWGVVGGAVAAVGLGVGLGTKDKDAPAPSLGSIQ